MGDSTLLENLTQFFVHTFMELPWLLVIIGGVGVYSN